MSKIDIYTVDGYINSLNLQVRHYCREHSLIHSGPHRAENLLV